MSRVGKKPIELAGAQVELDKSSNNIKVKGPKGELSHTFLPFVKLDITDKDITVSVESDKITLQRAMWGTARALVNNMIQGVTKGFKKQLELNGVGYKMDLRGSELVLNIGFSHPVHVPVPQGVKLTLNKNLLDGESHDKQLIGDFFMKVHNMKPCEPYKHKGFKIPGRFYPKKVGKKAAKAE